MKIVDIRDGFIKIESTDSIPLSSFLQIGDGIKQYIAQVIRSVSSAVTTTLYAKILFINDGILKNYDGTKPDRNSPIRSCTEEFIEQTLISNTPICIGDFIENDINIFIDAKHFNKKMFVCFDDKEKFNGFISNITEQFTKHKKVLVIDMQGIVTGDKCTAGQDFKLPLNTNALNFIYSDCLSDATVDSKETVKDMFTELAEYSKTVDFLPFNTLKTIVDDMVDNKHVFKLLIFKNKLKKFAQIGCFAETKDEANSLSNILTQPVATIDLSKLDSVFQNYYLENIYNKLTDLKDDIQVFVNVSNSINKKNLKNIITDSNISSTFMSNSKFKYLDEIKTFFDNFIIEPSITINNIFNIYANFLKSMDTSRYLIVGDGTSYIPLVCKVNTDVFEVEEPEIVSQINEFVEPQMLDTQADIEDETQTYTEKAQFETEINEENSTPENDEQNNEQNDEQNENEIDVINAANETFNSISEPVIELNEPENVKFQSTSDEIEENTENTESDIPQITPEDINDIIDSKTEILAEDENISITVGSETFEMFVENDSDKISEVESLSASDFQNQIENDNISENIEIQDSSEDINTEFVSDKNVQPADSHDETTAVDFVEPQNNFAESLEEIEPETDFVNETDFENINISEIKLEDFGARYNNSSNDTDNETDENKNENEMLTINTDENVDLDSDILIELDNDIQELDAEALDKEIIDDVDKVFTTIKDDSISMDDLDFIDELNNNNSSQNEILEIGELDEELIDELQEYGEELLEQNDEDDTQSEEFVQERLETKRQTTPSVPVYNAEIPQEDIVKSDTLEQGDTVSHATYGNGIVEKKCKYGSKDLLLINFDNVGRRALDPTLTELKKI